MGRRCKSSNSTVATIDYAGFAWTKETAVLKRVSKDLPDEDWPILFLKDAVIYEKDGVSIGNPLFLDNEKVGPMVLRGRLEVEVSDDQDVTASLIKPRTKPVNIEISKSVSYAIGYDSQDLPALWVSGAAGWYEIRPAPLYENMYLEIREAIMLYYEALIVHEEYEKQCRGRKKKPKPPVPTCNNVFFRYAVRAGDGVTLAETEARYVKWAPFLAAHFPKETDFKWDGYPFAQWIQELAANRPKDDFPRTIPQSLHKARRAAPVFEDDSESQGEVTSERSRSRIPTRAHGRHSTRDVEMVDLTTSRLGDLPIRKGKDKARIETPVPLPPQYQLSRVATPVMPSTAASESPVDRLLDVLQEIASEKNLAKAKAATIHTQIYLKCKINDYKAPAEITAFYSKQLLPRLGAEWRSTAFYQWLEESSRKPVVLEHTTAEKIPFQVVRRAVKAAPRPTLSKTPPGSFLGRTSASQSRLGDDSEEDIRPARGRRSGKNAGLRPPSSKKRPASEMDIDSEFGTDGRRGRKTAKTSHVVSDEDDETSEMSNDESILNTDEDEGDNIAFPAPPPKDSVRIVVHAERIPTMSPAGPNGTWMCEEEGCNYVVRAAEERAGQELIEAHFRGHEAQAVRVNLAMKESRGHLPINHLLDKIQALGQKALEKKNGQLNGQPLPAPIKRRLFL